jgi:predicted nucleic-acid-binding protein
VRAVDTNVLARLLLADDPVQHAIAVTISEKPIWITSTVWLELGWLLGKKLKVPRHVISDMFTALLSTNTVNTSDEDGLRWAIDRFRAGADWGDMMHLIMARDVAETFATFDRGIASAASGDAPLSVETLA